MSVKCAIAALCTVRASALKAEVGQHRFVRDIVAEEYKDILANKVDTSDMIKLHIKAFDGSDKNITIMGYPKEEDKEISGSLQADAHWETFQTGGLCSPWTEQHLRGVFLDVGTNIGTYSLPMADCIRPGGNGTVLSIEGMPQIADHYRAGILANEAKNVALYEYAVGGTSGPDYVTMTLDPQNKGGSSVTGNKAGDASILKAGVREIQVPLTTLDVMLKKDDRFKAVLSAKIDIEGNEGRMLQGAEEFFSNHTPCFLMIELIHEWLTNAGTPVEGILEKFGEWGYARVPTAEWLHKCSWRARTIHLRHKNLEACYKRVEEAYASL